MLFYEEQRYSGGWRWFWAAIILGPGAVALLVFLILTITTGTDFRLALLIVAAVEVLELALFLLVIRTPVIVRVTGEGIHIRVPPFVNERVTAAEVKELEEVSTGLRRRYGAGVGKRYGDRRARYTVGNDAGVVLERTDGWRLVIGSQRPAELAAAIRDLR